MPYHPVLTPTTCYKGLFDVNFSMVNLDLKSITEKMNAGQTPFKHFVRCNMGNPAGVGQKEITLVRQLISCCVYPELMEKGLFPADVIERAKRLLNDMPGKNTGAYQATEGLASVRKNAAAYVSERDGYEAKPESFFFSNGATEAIMTILRPIIRGPEDAIFTPKPGFPMYNATITYYGGAEVSYELDEDQEWGVTDKCLEEAMEDCLARDLFPRCMVLINPSNPTGTVETREHISECLKYAYKHNMVVIADEVYQHNIYEPERFPFISARKVLKDLEKEGQCVGLELFSVNSASKSMYGECGRRGGYWQIDNINDKVISELLDVVSLGATNTDGMIAMDVVINPPKPEDPSYALWNKEYQEILRSLQRKARMVAKEMAGWHEMHCNTPLGAMYVFPRIFAPPKAEEAAQKLGKHADDLYCQDLLEAVGVICLPGGMFGQAKGTYHLRMTILPEEDDIKDLLKRWKVFHEQWIKKYE